MCSKGWSSEFEDGGREAIKGREALEAIKGKEQLILDSFQKEPAILSPYFRTSYLQIIVATL